MARTRWIIPAALLCVAACTSAAEKQRKREEQMIAQAKEDAEAEAEFVADSLKLAASITVDTVRETRAGQDTVPDDDSVPQLVQAYIALSPSGTRCTLTPEKFRTLVVGDTLSCQWATRP